ncbi:TIGR02450 family Trp-rich protein [Psychromonas sp.]|uniref:TIGR02450 family Trp-rich protein n=1 Tax=Psychromonas sp. TaxID=1884585 RepID=UPI003568D106
MNRISPKALLHSKWTKTTVVNKERHFVVTEIEFNEDKKIIRAVIQAVINHAEYEIDWRELKDGNLWLIGWQ